MEPAKVAQNANDMAALRAAVRGWPRCLEDPTLASRILQGDDVALISYREPGHGSGSSVGRLSQQARPGAAKESEGLTAQLLRC
jgi:hypothetical protein